MANRDINQEWMEWCKQHEGFPEDFIAEAMRDREEKAEKDDKSDIYQKALSEARASLTVEGFMTAAAGVMADYSDYAEEFDVEFDSERYARFVARLMHRLFDAEIEMEVRLIRYREERGEKE